MVKCPIWTKKLDQLIEEFSALTEELKKAVNESYSNETNMSGSADMSKKECSCEKCPSCLKKSEDYKERLVIKSNGQWELTKGKDKPNPMLAGAVMLGTLYSMHEAKQSKKGLEATMSSDRGSEVTRTPASMNSDAPETGRNIEAHKPKKIKKADFTSSGGDDWSSNKRKPKMPLPPGESPHEPANEPAQKPKKQPSIPKFPGAPVPWSENPMNPSAGKITPAEPKKYPEHTNTPQAGKIAPAKRKFPPREFN